MGPISQRFLNKIGAERTNHPRFALQSALSSPRIGRVLIAQGGDAADVPITRTFGPNTLVSFNVWTDEVEAGPLSWPRGLFRQQVRQLIRACAADFIDLPRQHQRAGPQRLDLRGFGMLLLEFLDPRVE
jgi:hypothetical protein